MRVSRWWGAPVGLGASGVAWRVVVSWRRISMTRARARASL